MTFVNAAINSSLSSFSLEVNKRKKCKFQLHVNEKVQSLQTLLENVKTQIYLYDKALTLETPLIKS